MDQPKKYEEFSLPLNQIIPDENQPRKQFLEAEIEALADNIKDYGMIEPIVVTHTDDDKYKIVSGERRWRALKRLVETFPEEPKWMTIKVSVIENDDPILSIMANLVKQELNPMEYALALEELKKAIGKKGTQNDIAKLVEKSKSNISEWYSLLELPQSIRDHAIKNNILPFTSLKKLASKRKKMDAKQLEDEYFSLCETISPTNKSDIENETSVSTRKRSTAIVAANKKITDTCTVIQKIKVEKIEDEETKYSLLESLDKMIRNAEELKAAIQGSLDS